ncbi:hypothetical protein AVEN_127572-1 [Araneus ventricosus]|uniref:Tc1-like transposase DDE domain-containing protein n=1 Tax=Araneus ventricosus TaxID=182803 RepID=A0A4Y2P759_ARAVE|nr:hypothetical protein AVEN_127572-1 [Araneus ventricosus]
MDPKSHLLITTSTRRQGPACLTAALTVNSPDLPSGIYLSEDLPLSDLRNVWFQHDGAPPHKVSSVQQYNRDIFQQQVIGYGGCVGRPPRSPDLNPLDFFLCEYIKQRMYATPPSTLQELRNRITDACASALPAMLYNVQRKV